MCKPIVALTCSLLSSCAILWGGQAFRSTLKVPPAGVKGRITIDEVVGHDAQTNPIAKLKIYLLRVEDSRSLVELQEGCRRVTADLNVDPLKAYQTCEQNLQQAMDMLPTLPAVATTETDRNGEYEFAEIPAAGRYKVVGVKTVEGAEPYLVVGMTNKLKPGERVIINLSANDPWTKATTP
jgi:hypothetical protein